MLSTSLTPCWLDLRSGGWHPGVRHWSLFVDLCRRGDAKGSLIRNAWIAAIASEQGATLVTADRDYRRFPGLRVEDPFDRLRA